MDNSKVKQFISLAGQHPADSFITGTPEQRELGAQLLLSETLEYVIKGLGVIPKIGNTVIDQANDLTYHASQTPDREEMLDGLADVAYTMFWNAVTFGIPLEDGYELVCQNNLEKFIEVDHTFSPLGELQGSKWHCGKEVLWPKEVVHVFVIQYGEKFFAVGKDKSGKVRKPSTYKGVDLLHLVPQI